MFSARHIRKSCLKAFFKTLCPSSSDCACVTLGHPQSRAITTRGFASAEVVADTSIELQVNAICSLGQALHAVRVQLLTGVAVSDAHPHSLDLILHTYALRMNVSSAPGTSDQRSRIRLMSKERYSGSDRSTCGMPMCLCWRGFLTILLTAAPVAGSSRASCQQSTCNCCYPSTLSRKLLCPAKPCHVEHAVLRSSSGNLPSRGACVTSICPFGGTADPFLHSL